MQNSYSLLITHLTSCLHQHSCYIFQKMWYILNTINRWLICGNRSASCPCHSITIIDCFREQWWDSSLALGSFFKGVIQMWNAGTTTETRWTGWWKFFSCGSSYFHLFSVSAEYVIEYIYLPLGIFYTSCPIRMVRVCRICTWMRAPMDGNSAKRQSAVNLALWRTPWNLFLTSTTKTWRIKLNVCLSCTALCLIQDTDSVSCCFVVDWRLWIHAL